MIEFATLLIGLVVGTRPVEVAVQGPVAVVELYLDGQLVARLEEAPWAAEVDFGHWLRPHRLSAVAFDSGEQRVDVIHQIVNYSRSSFEAAIVLDAQTEGHAQQGRVIWEGAIDEPPRRIELTFDAAPLAVAEDGSFVLPEYSPGTVHVVEATVTFADGNVGVASSTVGGQYAERTTTTLTAVPLASPPLEPWTTDRVRGWLQVGDRPLEIFTTTAPNGRLVILRDRLLERAVRAAIPMRNQLARSRYTSSAYTNYEILAISPRPLKDFPGTFSMTRPGEVHPRVGLRWPLLHDGPLVPERKDRRQIKKTQMLWDALAVAGLHAARTNVPRVVLLMLGRRPHDESQLAPEQVLDYLSSIQVPLLVWAPDPQALAAYGLGENEQVFFGARGIIELETEVGERLNSQTLVWVEGDYLPTEIILTERAPPSVALLP